jgi:hypothetical protein
MDVQYLKALVEKRESMTDSYPQFIGRHQYYQSQKQKIKEGIEMIESGVIDSTKLRNLGVHFIKVRQCEKASHLQRVQTDGGNKIHNAEQELYSMALDVFQTYSGE